MALVLEFIVSASGFARAQSEPHSVGMRLAPDARMVMVIVVFLLF